VDDSKLYKALLKQQSRQNESREADSPDADEAAAVGKTENKPGPPATGYRVEPPYRIERVPSQPGKATGRERLIHYDASISLDMIDNPVPWSMADLRERKLVYPSMSAKSILNAYRELRIKLRQRSGDANGLIMMSSLSRKVSSIQTAFNLAITFAMDAHTSALLVDCNPYESSLDHLVSVPLGDGITDFIASTELDVKDIIYPSGVARLSVIPAGHLATSAVELFSSSRMKKVMEELKSRYPDRFIIMYAPPFTLSTEARILERFADHTVFTVPFGELTAESILESIESVSQDTFAGLVYQE